MKATLGASLWLATLSLAAAGCGSSAHDAPAGHTHPASHDKNTMDTAQPDPAPSTPSVV